VQELQVAATRWRVEELFEDGKGDFGLADYEARSWTSWHLHMTLVALAHPFITANRHELKQDIPELTLPLAMQRWQAALQRPHLTEAEATRLTEYHLQRNQTSPPVTPQILAQPTQTPSTKQAAVEVTDSSGRVAKSASESASCSLSSGDSCLVATRHGLAYPGPRVMFDGQAKIPRETNGMTRVNRSGLLLLLISWQLSPLTFAQQQDRAKQVKDDRAAFALDDYWIYNDLQAGITKAKETGRPMVVVFR